MYDSCYLFIVLICRSSIFWCFQTYKIVWNGILLEIFFWRCFWRLIQCLIWNGLDFKVIRNFYWLNKNELWWIIFNNKWFSWNWNYFYLIINIFQKKKISPYDEFPVRIPRKSFFFSKFDMSIDFTAILNRGLCNFFLLENSRFVLL